MQRRRLGLLALLATAPPGGMSRERLAAYLFPDADTPRAHRALSDAVHAVRKALGRGAIVAAGDALRLDPDVVGSDVRQFEAKLAAGDLAGAVALYRGPFLDGFFVPEAMAFERWVEAERSERARRVAEVLETLAESAERSGALLEASGWWERLATHDPYSSRIALRLARALAASGDSARALRCARAHLTLLRDELEVDADPEVLALVARLQSQERTRHESAGDDGASRDRAPPAPRGRADRPLPSASTQSDEAVVASDGTTDPAAAPPPRAVQPRTSVALAAVLFASVLLAVILTAAPWRGGRDAVTAAQPAAPVDPAARELYLRGRQAWSERSRDGLERAVGYFRAAAERDPDYALAYAGLADAYVLLGYLGYRPAAAMFPKGKAAAQRALELDSTLAEAYAPLGQALMWEHDWAGAERAYQTAIRMKPEYATAHQWYGILLLPLGRMREAVAHTRRASELDPLSLQINNTYGMFLHFVGESDAALRQYQKIVEAEPDSLWVRQNPWLLSNASRVYAAHGLYEDALRSLQQALTVAPRHPRLLGDLASTYVAMGQPDRALQAFAAADTANDQYAYFRAAVFAVLGQADSAFHWLGRIEEWGPVPLGELRANPRLAPIRSDPRYAALLRRLRLIE